MIVSGAGSLLPLFRRGARKASTIPLRGEHIAVRILSSLLEDRAKGICT